MARGDKDYDKTTHGLKGKSAEAKKKALHAMVEAIVAGNTEDAGSQLHSYLKIKSREILVGESDEGEGEEAKSEEKEESSEDKKEDKAEDKDEEKKDDDKDEEKKDDDKKVDESVTHHPEGALSRKVKGDVKFANGGKKTAKKLGNAAPHLDDKIKGDVKFANGGKKTAEKHGNSAPHLDGSVKGNVYKK